MLDSEQAQAVLREAYKLKASAFRGKQKKTIKVITFPHLCEQRDANKYVPSGSSVWRSLKRGEWCGHNPPYVRVSASFRKSGSSEEALRHCLAKLWRQELDKHSQPLSECPISGLFD